MKKTLAATAIAAAIAGGALSGASPANAVQSSCHTAISHSYTALCSKGTGKMQAWAQCKQVVWPWNYSTVTGPWVGVGQISQANCGWGTNAQNGGMSFR